MEKTYKINTDVTLKISRFKSRSTGKIFFKADMFNSYENYHHTETHTNAEFTADEKWFDYVYDCLMEYYHQYGCCRYCGD